jgi:uncharacterized protein
MYLQRKSYIDAMRPYLQKPIIKIITGMRRVGKSTIMRQLMEHIPSDRLCAIHREYSSHHWILSDAELTPYLRGAILQGKDTLCIDEVQLITHWERSINAIHAEYPHVDIVLTGSNSDLLSSELSTLLSGRYMEFRIYPFSFWEYCAYKTLSEDATSYESYIQSSGLPSLYTLGTNEFILREWLENLKNTIFLKNITARYMVRDVFLLEEIFLWLVNNMGNITNLSKIVTLMKNRGIKTNHNTLATYIDYMKKAFLIYEVPLYDLRGKQIFDRERKFYITDHAWRTALFSGYDTGMGKILENIVFLEGLRHGYKISVGRIGDREIDFVMEKGWLKKYIQVAYLLADEQIIEREFGNLRQIPDNWDKYVVSMDRIAFGNHDGIKHVQLWNLESIW